MFDDVLAELGTFDFDGAFHKAGEVVGHALRGDGAAEALFDEVGRLAEQGVLKPVRDEAGHVLPDPNRPLAEGAGDRDDLVQREEEQLKVLEEFLPEEMSDEEIEQKAKEVIEEAM